MPRIKFALFCYFSFYSINYLNLTFRGQKNCHCQKNTWYRETILLGKEYAKFSWAVLVDSSWIPIIFSRKDLRFCLSYKTSKECSKRSIQLQTGKIFFMIFSINSFHSILSTSKKWRLRLTMIDVLIYYLLIWKPIEPIVGLIGSTCEKTATCFLLCAINFGHVFPSIILLPTSCINLSAATIHNITMLFLFFPLRVGFQFSSALMNCWMLKYCILICLLLENKIWRLFTACVGESFLLQMIFESWN